MFSSQNTGLWLSVLSLTEYAIGWQWRNDSVSIWIATLSKIAVNVVGSRVTRVEWFRLDIRGCGCPYWLHWNGQYEGKGSLSLVRNTGLWLSVLSSNVIAIGWQGFNDLDALWLIVVVYNECIEIGGRMARVQWSWCDIRDCGCL